MLPVLLKNKLSYYEKRNEPATHGTHMILAELSIQLGSSSQVANVTEDYDPDQGISNKDMLGSLLAGVQYSMVLLID